MAIAPSPLLHALDRALVLSVEENAPGSTKATRGGLEPSADGTVTYLSEVTNQIGQVQTWLKEHPELLIILDKGIRDEVRRMERRVTLVNIVSNLGFTVLGTIFGLVLPSLLSTIGH